MNPFRISLAGIPIEIMPMSPSSEAYFQEYLCDDPPQISISVTPRDIDNERAHSVRQRAAEGLPPQSFSDDYLETLSILRRIAERIVDYGVILFHGSVVSVDGSAYLFTAPSGTGKTTHTQLWLQLLPQAHILNGDKPFLKVEADGRVLACGTPWQGKENFGCNEILPLKAICLLERGERNQIEAIAPKAAFNAILHQAHMPGDGASTVKALRLVDRILGGVSLYRLRCNMDPEAARISIDAMLSDGKDTSL